MSDDPPSSRRPTDRSFLGFAPDAAVVVTGAGSGIGAEVARESARQELGVAAWEQDARVLGDLAYLAGVAGPPSFLPGEFTERVDACLTCMRNPAQALIGHDTLTPKAAVLFSSVQGPHYGAGVEWYTVAKAAIDGYMRSLAGMRPGGLRANAILPDWILTPRTASHAETVAPDGVWAVNPSGRIGQPADCAKATLFLLSPAAEYISGVSLPIDGGMRLRSVGWLTVSEMI